MDQSQAGPSESETSRHRMVKRKAKKASPVHVIAQQFIDRAKISVTGLELERVRKDGLDLRIDIRARKVGPFRVRLHFPEALAMTVRSNYLGKGKGKSTLPLPDVFLRLEPFSIGPGTSHVHLHGRMMADSPQELASFARRFVERDFLQIQLLGDLEMRLFGVKLRGLYFDKTVEVQGLDYLDGLVTFSSSEEHDSAQSRRNIEIKAEQIDIVRGTKDGLELSISTELPKLVEYELHLGRIELEATRQGLSLGALLIPAFTLKPGKTKLDATLLWTNTSRDAVGLMSSIVSGGQLVLVLRSTQRTSPSEWLAEALKDLKITCRVASLQHTMVQSVDLVVSSDFVESSAAQIALTLENHFGVLVGVKTAKVEIKYKGEAFGVASLTEKPGHIGLLFEPQKQTISASDFELRFESKALVQVLRLAARDNGVNLGQDFEELLALLNKNDARSFSRKRYSITERKEPLDIAKLVGAAIAVFEVDLAMDTTLLIGEFETRFKMSQSQVPVKLGSSVKHVIPFVARPIIERIVTELDLEIRHVRIKGLVALSHRPQNPGSMNLAIEVAVGLTNFGPVEARLHVPEPAIVLFKGHKAATLKLEDFDVLQGLHGEDHVLFGELLIDQATEGMMQALMHSEAIDFDVEIPKFDVQAGGALFEDVPGLKRSGKVKGFKGPRTTVESFTICGEDLAAKRLLVELEMTFHNPSTLELQPDSMTLAVLYKDEPIGEVTGTNILMKPLQGGPMKVAGYVARSGNKSTTSDAFSDLVNRVASGFAVELSAVGRSIQFAGQTSPLPWLDEAFKGLLVPVTVPAQVPISIVDCGAADLQLCSAEGFSSLFATGKISLTLGMPYRISLAISEISGEFICSWNGQQILDFKLVDLTVRYDQHNKRLEIVLDSFEIKVSDLTIFSRFAACIVGSQSPILHLESTVKANVGLSTGHSAVDIPISFDLPLKGLDRMKSVDRLRLSRVEHKSSAAHELWLFVDIGMDTSDIIALDFTSEDTISLMVSCGSQAVARLFIRKGNFRISHPYTILQGELQLAAPKIHENEIRGLISRFVTGRPTILRISGDDQSSSSPVLRHALKNFGAELTLQSYVDCTMIESLQVLIGTGLFKWDKSASATCVIRNYFDIPLFINRLRVKVLHKYKVAHSDEPVALLASANDTKLDDQPRVLGLIDSKFDKPAMSIAPRLGTGKPTTAQSSKMQVDLSISLMHLAKIFVLAKGMIKVDVEVLADIAIGDYTIESLEYSQQGLTLDIVGLETIIKLANGIYERIPQQQQKPR